MIEEGVKVGVIIAIGEGIKKTNTINVKYLPLIDVVLGVVIGVVYGSGDIRMDVFQGLIMGLTAAGLYSGVKNVGQGMRESEKK